MSTLSAGDERLRTGKPDAVRLGIFVGLLVAFAAVLLLVSRLADVSMVALAPIYMLTPLLAGVTVCLVRDVPLTHAGLRVGRPRWSALSVLLAVALVGVTLLLSIALPGIAFDPTADPAPGLSFPAGIPGVLAVFGLILVAGTTVNAALAFGEEFGWRGYLLWELAPLGFWKASLAIGAIWGIWHAPVIAEGYNYPSYPIVGVGVMTVACIAFSPVYTYLVLRAESVLAAAFFHGVFNGSAGLVLVYTATESPALGELVASPVGVASIVVFALVALGLDARGTPPLDRTFAGEGTDATRSDRSHRSDVDDEPEERTAR